MGTSLIDPRQMKKLVRKGITITNSSLEVRGLRWEIEFRSESTLLGRVRKDDFLIALTFVAPG